MGIYKTLLQYSHSYGTSRILVTLISTICISCGGKSTYVNRTPSDSLPIPPSVSALPPSPVESSANPSAIVARSTATVDIVRCPSVVAEIITPYPTPSLSNGVMFMSDADRANNNARYTGRIVFSLKSTGLVTSYTVTIENTGSEPLTVDVQEFRFVSSQDRSQPFPFKSTGFSQVRFQTYAISCQGKL